MGLDKRDREILKYLIEKEIVAFDKDADIVRHDIILLKGEEQYDSYLKELLKKL